MTTTTSNQTDAGGAGAGVGCLPPSLQVLVLLDAYNKRQSVGQLEQKDCLWNLQKARRDAMRGSVTNANVISACSVREELYPRVRLVDVHAVSAADGDVIPELVQDNNRKEPSRGTADTATITNTTPRVCKDWNPQWKTVDPMAMVSSDTTKTIHESMIPTTTLVDHEDYEIIPDNKENQIGLGLRQRRGKTKGAAKVDPIQNKDIHDTKDDDDNDDGNTHTTTELQDELTLLRKANPIELFGALPPRDLRQAQSNANDALQAYIDAANFAVSILTLTQKTRE